MPPPYITAPDSDFTDQIDELQLTSAAAADATLLMGQREWMYPPLHAWSGDPFDIVGMNSAFKRTNLNQIYVNILDDVNTGGTVGETMAIKAQVDYIATIERAFRTRYCSSVRARLHASSRRAGQGDANGLFIAVVQAWIQQLIDAAHA